MTTLHEMKKNYIPVKLERYGEEYLQWFRESKFGFFIHWGLYSILGKGEWEMFKERMNVSEYAKLAERFDAKDFNPRAWAKAAKEAGMKYMVLTARHHDGFCLFDSKASEFNSVNSAAKRDLVAEYVDACRAEGLKVGLYYCPMDWRFPGYFFPEMYLDSALQMKEQCWAQIRELMTNYGKIDILWYDGEWLAHGGIKNKPGSLCEWWTDPNWMKDEIYMKVNYFWESEKLNAMVKELQPGILVNNRSGWEGDFHTRECHIGEIRTDKAWEACEPMGAWGWMPDMPMFSLRELIQKLVAAVVRDGNYLLNIGPMPQGEFEQRHLNRIREMGEWLEQYGHSIYGTRGGPFLPGDWGGTTYKENKVYVHITEWKEEKIILPTIDNKLIAFSGLNVDNIDLTQTDNGIEIGVPTSNRDGFDTIIVLEFEKPIFWAGIAAKEADIYGLADGLNANDS